MPARPALAFAAKEPVFRFLGIGALEARDISAIGSPAQAWRKPGPKAAVDTGVRR
jgi:hypothetical protein